jgi:hypothetical protein
LPRLFAAGWHNPQEREGVLPHNAFLTVCFAEAAARRRNMLWRVIPVLCGRARLRNDVMICSPRPTLLALRLLLAAGLAILSRDVPFARRLLVNVRARIPENERGEISRPILIGGLLLSTVTVSFSLWWWLFRG